MNKQVPNWQEARNFLAALTGESNPEITFQTFDDKGEDFTLAAIRTGKLTDKEIRNWLLASVNSGCGIFFTLNRTDGKGRRRANMVEYRVTGLDLDGTELPQSWSVEPDLIDESSPGKFHALWLLQPGTDFKAWSDCQARVASYYGGDKRVFDPPRVFRLPGFYHQKGEPFRSRVLTWPKAGVQFDRHDLGELAAAHECEYDAPGERKESDRATTPDDWDAPADIEVARAKLAKVKPASGDRNNVAYRMAAMLNDHAISPEMSKELLTDWNESLDDPLPDREIAHVIRSAPEYKQSPAGSAATISPQDDFDDDIDPKWLPTKAEVAAAKKKKNLLRGVSFSALMRLADPSWLIDGILAENALFEIYGEFKAGKTFFGLEMALCIATGADFLDETKTTQGDVLYIIAEGNRKNFGYRIAEWISDRAGTSKTLRDRYTKDIEQKLRVVGVPVHMDAPDRVKAFIAANPGNWKAIFVDTLMRNMTGDPMKPADMIRFMSGCDDLRALPSAPAVVFLHHMRREGGVGGYGPIVGEAFVDGAATVARKERTKERSFTIKVMRDADDTIPSWVCEIQSVNRLLDMTDEGEITRSVGVLKFKRRGDNDPEALILCAIYTKQPTKIDELVKLTNLARRTVDRLLGKLRDKKDLQPTGLSLTKAGLDRAAETALT